jgi:hypothetical protein
MTKMESSPGIVRRLEPNEDSNPGGALKVETTGGTFVVELTKTTLQPTRDDTERAVLEKKLLRWFEAREKANDSSAKARPMTLSSHASTCKLRLTIELGEEGALEWEGDLDFGTSRHGHDSQEK